MIRQSAGIATDSIHAKHEPTVFGMCVYVNQFAWNCAKDVYLRLCGAFHNGRDNK